MKNKITVPWLLVLGLLAALGGWAWTQSVESLSLPSSAGVGQTVTAAMTNLISGQDYLLDWSDGTTDSFNTGRGTTQNLSHSYAGAGTFIVILKRVTAGDQAPVAQSSINISYPPCNILVTPSNTVFASPTSAQVSSLVPNLAWNMDWGDGTIDAFTSSATGGFTGNHTFATTGTFQLKVTTPPLSAGIAGTPICLATAQVSLPVPTLAVAPSSVTLGQAVSANVGNLLAAITYTLDWGDGSSDPISGVTTASISHTYANASFYTVKVTATGIAPVIQGITVKPPPPSLVVSPNPAGVGDLVSANITSLISSVNYTLAWGDGASETIGGVVNMTSQHVYATAGTFSVQLTATGFVPVISSITITIPTPTLSVPSSATVGQSVTANVGNLVSIVAYNLDWGDGVVDPIGGAVSLTPTHTYSNPGTFSVKLSATGIAPVIQSINVGIPTPTLAMNPATANIGQNITANLGNLISSVNYSLDWGDGVIDPISGVVTAAPTHAYALNGTFTVKLTATGIAPVISSITITIPTPTLVISPSSITLGQATTATLTNLVSSVSYSLDWGDGSSDPVSGVTTLSVPHTYATASTFTAKLTATGIAPVISSVTVTIPAPNLAIAPNPTEVGHEVTANVSNLIGSVDYTLNWGDGASDPITGVMTFTSKHTFAAAGTFAAKITATGIAPVILPVTVGVPAPTLLLDSNAVDLGQAAKASLGNLVASLQYTLDWGDGSSDTTTGKTKDVLLHTYAKPGTFPVKLLVTGAAPVIDTITVALPTAAMTLSPNPVNLGQAMVAKLTGLASSASYTLDWGDGSSDPITGVSNAELKHTYTVAGIYVVGLSAPGGAPVIGTATVEIPLPTLNLSSSNINPGQSLTATLGNLLPVVTYTLEWGDNSANETFSGVSSAAPKHTYAAAGTYVVKLTYPNNAPVIQPITVSVPVAGFDLNPNPALPDQLVTANLNQLLAAVDYSLEWGDGTISTISGQTASSLQHRYSALGQYFVRLIYPGGVTQIKPITVNLANLDDTLAFTGIESANSVITFKMTGLLKSLGYQYTLQFGENNEFELVSVKADGTATVKHTYDNAGVKIVKLVLNGAGANNLPRKTLTLNLSPAVQVSSLKLAFQPQNSTQVNVKKLSLQKVVLAIGYTGGGLLEGNWILDNQILEAASLNLNVNKTPGTLEFNIPTSQEGLHILEFKTIPDPNTPGSVAKLSNRITYNVTPATLPTLLEIGGFTLEIKTVTSPLINQFSGTATLDLIVGGALAAENIPFDFSGLTVSINGNTAKVFSGQLEKKFSPLLELTTPLGLAPQKLSISRLLLTTGGAKLDGSLPVSRPSCIKYETAGANFSDVTLEKISKSQPVSKGKYTPGNAANQGATQLAQPALALGERFEFSNQSLSAGGDLYATGITKTNDIKLGCTGVTLKANQAAILDLSDTQSPNVLKSAYGANPTPPDTSAAWMGLFFPTAKLEIKGTLEATATAPVAFSAGGYNFDLILGGANAPARPGRIPNGIVVKTKANYRGWEFTIDTLDLGVTQTEVVNGQALGTTKVPFLIETLKAVFTWQPDANWAIATQGVVKHDFGKTRIYAGAGAFVEQSQNLVLKFQSAVWAIGAIATSSSDLKNTEGYTSDLGSGDNVAISANTLTVSGVSGISSNVPAGGVYQVTQGQGTGNGAPVYAPVIGGTLEELTESAVKVDLPGLTISLDGNTTLQDGQIWRSVGKGGDLKLLGFAFPVTKVGLAREANRYYLGLEGQLEMGRLNDNDALPTRKSVVRYYVKNGKDDVLVMDKDAYQADVNATTKFNLAANTQTWQLASLGTTTALLNKKTSSNTLLASKRNSSSGMNKLAAGGADFELADGGTIDIEGMSATVNAAFGLKGGVDYFFVWANLESDAPLFSLGVMSFFEFHGGVAHHMKWATGKYRQKPTFNKDTVLQIQLGAVLGTPTDGSTIHLDGTILVDISGSVEIYADGWLFTTVADGYRAKAKPIARAYIGINKDRLLLQACVGKSSPPKGGITCSDLKDLSFYGVATANGWLELYVPFKNTHMHLYVGSYSNPVNATFFQIYKATGYVMLGYIEGDQKPPAAQVGFGFWAGGSVGYDFNKHDEGSAICDWEWHFGFHYIIAADFGVQVTPTFYIDASVSFSAGFKAGAHVCGIGANFEIDIDLYGHIHAPKPTQFDGTAKLYIDLPIIPTFTVKVSVNITF